MKKNLLLTLMILTIAIPLYAGGKFQSVNDAEILPGSATATVIDFVKSANAGDFKKASEFLSREYMEWRQRFGGIEKYFNYFKHADLTKTFQFRIVSESDNRTEITVKLFSLPKNAEQNYRMYVSKIEDSWKITRK